MGEVYRARDTRLDRVVAVKILPPQLAADPQFRERFDREAVRTLEPALKPDAASGGWLYKSDAQLRPDRLMSEWRKVLEKQGVTIHENCELQGFSTQPSGAKAVLTNQGEIPATSFVLATGAWTPLLALENRQIIVDTTTGKYAVIGKIGEMYGNTFAWVSTKLLEQWSVSRN